MNQENKIRKDLLSKHRRDLHIRFFQQNTALSSVKVPVVSTIDATKRLTPFRNTKCVEPDCVYDLQDLVNMCKSFNYKYPVGFNCGSCNMYIEFKNFFLDDYLKNIVDSIWESHNSENKVVYDSIIIRRNGSWQPVPSSKSTNMTNNSIDQVQMMMNRTSDTRKDSQARTSVGYTTMTTWRDDKTVTEGDKPVTIVNYENPPHLCEYNPVEYEQLFSAFERSSTEDTVILRRDDAIVTRDDLRKLEHDEIVTSQTMSMFVWYLNVLQKVHGKIYNKKHNGTCYVAAFKVCSFDQFKKQVRYNTISSSLEYQGRHHEACNTHDKITLLLSIEQRWVVAVLDLIEKRLVLVDFLQDDLSRMKAPEMLEIIKYLVRAEFQFTYNEVKLYDVPKLSFISDCGLYALSFVYKCISNPVLDNIRIKFLEKELFRKQVVWLLLKMRTLKKTEVQLFMAPENSYRDTNKTSLTRQAFEDSLLMRVPSFSSEQVSSVSRFHAKSCNNLLPEALASHRARINSKSNLKMMLNIKPASDSEAIVKTERARPIYNQPQFNSGLNRQAVSHWNLRDESNNNSLRAQRGSMLLQADYKRSLPDVDMPRSQDNSLLKPKTRTQEIKDKIMTKRKQVMSLNNLDAIEASGIKRTELKSILADFKKDILDAIKQEHSTQRNSEAKKISLLNPEEESRTRLPLIKQEYKYKSLNELVDEDLPDPRLFMPRKQGNIGFIGLPKSQYATDDDDDSLGGDDDDVEDSEESSPSIVLFGFQEENESPKRMDLAPKEETDKRPQRVIEEERYSGYKKGLEKEYEEEEEGGLFDYALEIGKSAVSSEKRLAASEYNRDLHEIREHGHDEEESPF